MIFAPEFLQTLPHRLIPNERGPYLSRWLLRAHADGRHVYIHFFHQSDAVAETHDHPWDGRSLILAGGYVEHRLTRHGTIDSNVFLPGDVNELEAGTFHRIELLEAAGCWTIFETSAKKKTWHFRDSATGALTPWRKALADRGLL